MSVQVDAERHGRRAGAKRFKQNSHPVMRVLVGVDVVVVFLPLAVLVLWAFARVWNYPDLWPSEFTLGNFVDIFSMKRDMPQIIASSILLSLCVAVVATIISLLAAKAIAHYSFRGRRIADFSSLLPLMVSATAFGMGIHVFMLQQGWANTYFGVFVVHLLLVIPYGIKMLADPLSIMGTSASEQARNLGASSLQAFFHVDLAPLLPSAIAAMSLSFIVSFGQYFLTLIIGGGKVATLATVMVPWVSTPDRGLSAAFALLYLVITLAVFLLFGLLSKIVSRNRKSYLM